MLPNMPRIVWISSAAQPAPTHYFWRLRPAAAAATPSLLPQQSSHSACQPASQPASQTACCHFTASQHSTRPIVHRQSFFNCHYFIALLCLFSPLLLSPTSVVLSQSTVLLRSLALLCPSLPSPSLPFPALPFPSLSCCLVLFAMSDFPSVPHYDAENAKVVSPLAAPTKADADKTALGALLPSSSSSPLLLLLVLVLVLARLLRQARDR